MSYKKEKILVVDDERPIREILSASLADEGFVVDSAEDGLQALQKIEAFKPDVVLLDIWMPGELDGIGVLRAAKERGLKTDFIVMSLSLIHI